MATINVVMFDNESLLANGIVKSWNDKYQRPTSDDSYQLIVVKDATLNPFEQASPELVLLLTDTPSPEFQASVLEKCRLLNIRVLSIVGRASTVLVGPLEIPGQPGCGTCLQLRWEHSVRRTGLNKALIKQLGLEKHPNIPLSLTEFEIHRLGNIVVGEVDNILSMSAYNVQGQVGIYRRDGRMEWVPLVPSHDCPRCHLLPDDHPGLGSINFDSHFVEDMDALRVRLVDFNELNQLYAHSDIGYISAVHELLTEDNYVRASAQIQMPFNMSYVGYGAGSSSVEAKQKAIMEVLERSCAIKATNRRPVTWKTYAELRDSSVHPYEFGVHDEALYRSRSNNLERFDEEKKYSWIWAYATRCERPVLIPEQIAYYGNTRDDKRFVKESSNGCALGGTLEDAILHGLFEVLERDGLLNMWYGRLPVPELRLGKNCPEQVYQVTSVLQQHGYEVRLFNISHDLTIPAVLAVAIGLTNSVPKVVCGSSCHLNPYEAINGALRELMVQVLHLNGISAQRHLEGLSMLKDPSKIKDTLDHVVAAGLPEAFPRWDFLLNASRPPIQSIENAYSDVSQRYQLESRDIRNILNAVLEELHGRGFNVIVVNQTNIEVSYGRLHAVKVLVPGMTPITFGYGCRRVQGLSRVFELPFRMGYTSRVLTPGDLNEDCHPLA